MVLLLIVILLLSVLYVILAWSIVFADIWVFKPNPPQPVEKYGEFPFELTYTVHGEMVTIRDVYVCEYDGIGFNEGNGKYRKWNGYIKGIGEEYVVLVQDGDLKVCCSVGNANYYMGESNNDINESWVPNIFYIKSNNMGGTTSGGMPEEIEALKDKYKIQLISWTFSEPIENTFE